MGRFTQEKGFASLIRAFGVVACKHPEWTLEIWGDGPVREELVEVTRQHGLHDRVILPGYTSSPHERMRNADLFVLSSRTEGFPNVLCEALACGLPVVSFDCPCGPREIVRHGVDGVLVPNGDIDALAVALGEMMGDHQRRSSFASSAPEILERFGTQSVM